MLLTCIHCLIYNAQNLLTVVPVVGLLSKAEGFNPVLNEDEVDAIFDAPLEMFLKVRGNSNALLIDNLFILV